MTSRGLALHEILGHFIFFRATTYWTHHKLSSRPVSKDPKFQVWTTKGSLLILLQLISVSSFYCNPIRLFFTVDFTNWCLCLFFSLAYNCQGQRIYRLVLHVLLSRVMPGMWEKIANPWSMLSRIEQAAVMLYSTFPLVNQPVGMAWGTPAMCLPPLPETTSSPLIEKHQFKSPDPYATALTERGNRGSQTQ